MKKCTTIKCHQIELLYAFRGMSNKFLIEDDKLYAIVDDSRIELKGISEEPLPNRFIE